MMSFPTANWRTFVDATLSATIRHEEQLSYAGERAGLTGASLVQQFSLPPDTWLGSTPREVVARVPPPGYSADATLPIAHVDAPEQDDGRSFRGFFAPSLDAHGDAFTLRQGAPIGARNYTCGCGWTGRHACPASPTRGSDKETPYASDDGSACFRYCCLPKPPPSPPGARVLRARFPRLDKDVLIGEVSAASSAAAGLASSPTLLREALLRTVTSPAAKNLLPVPKLLQKPFEYWAADHVQRLVEECMPGGTQDLGVLLDLRVACADLGTCTSGGDAEGGGEGVEGDEEERVGFRGVDGAYTDNSGLAMTLATAMADCEAGRSRMDCSERTIDVLLVDDSPFDAPRTNDLGRFFSDSGTPPGDFSQLPPFWARVPGLTLFAEPYPRNWSQYSFAEDEVRHVQNNPFVSAADLPSTLEVDLPGPLGTVDLVPMAHQLKDGAEELAEITGGALQDEIRQQVEGAQQDSYRGSHVTSGTFTTIDNTAWGVRAGWKVRLLAFALDYPEVSGAPLDSSPIVLPPKLARNFFRFVYGPIARREIVRATPIIQRWLAGHDGVDGVCGDCLHDRGFGAAGLQDDPRDPPTPDAGPVTRGKRHRQEAQPQPQASPVLEQPPERPVVRSRQS